MIVLDTHIWVWWVMGDARLTQQHQQWLEDYRDEGLGVSIFSAWEVAKLLENNKLVLPSPVDEWLDLALNYPGVRLIDRTWQVTVRG